MEFLTTPIEFSLIRTSLLELIAVSFGLSSVWCMKKVNILAYPFGILNVLIYAYICFSAKLYAYAGINLFYFIMSIYGWYKWTRKNGADQRIRITACSRSEWFLYPSMVAVITFALFMLLDRLTDSLLPFWDAVTTAIYIIGMLLLAWKRLENWYYWITGDLISVGLFAHENLWFSSLQFAIFTVIAFLGLMEWKKRLSESV